MLSIDAWELKARKMADRAWETLRVNWHLGVTAFGGPPVHFKIVSVETWSGGLCLLPGLWLTMRHG